LTIHYICVNYSFIKVSFDQNRKISMEQFYLEIYIWKKVLYRVFK